MDKKDRQKMVDLLLLANEAIESGHTGIRFDRSTHVVNVCNIATRKSYSVYPGETYGDTFEEAEDYLNGLLKGEVAA